MEVTLELLLYYIRDLKPAVLKKPSVKACYRGVHLLMEEGGGSSDAEGASLYVAALSDLLNRKGCPGGETTVLLTADCKYTKKELERFSCGLILVDGKNKVPGLVNRLINVFQALTDWDKNMHIAALEGRSVQEIVDISERILAHPAMIFDAGFDVLAYTKNIPTSYAMFKGTTSNGFANSQTMELVKRNNILSRLKKGKPLVAPAVGDKSISAVYLSFYGDQNVLGYGCIFLENESVDPGYLDLVKLFSSNLNFCLKRDFDNQRFGQMLYETFLLQLINNPSISEEQFAEQVKNVEGLDEQGLYILGICEFAEQENVPLKFLARQLTSNMINVKPFLSENRICLLWNYSESSHGKEARPQQSDRTGALGIADGIKEALKKDADTLARVFEHYPFRIGYSNDFAKIRDLKYAYHQAKTALKYGALSDAKSYSYYRCYQYDLLRSLEEKMPVSYLQMGLYRQLKAYDEEHGTSCLAMMLCYIKCDCNATHTSEKLYLHRNTVRNTVLFVEEQWGVDISDIEVKKNLLTGEAVEAYLDISGGNELPSARS